jgi:hypothetical protein
MGFFFRTFYVPIGKNIRPNMPRDTLIGNITKITQYSESNKFFPEYQGTISIHDFRFASKYSHTLMPEGFASYKAADGKWPNGPELDALVYKYTRNFLPHDVHLKEVEKNNQRRIMVLLIMALVFVFPAVLFFLRKPTRV